MIFDLLEEFDEIVEAMPREHKKWRVLQLLEEAIRRDIHFIDRHPTALFQCLWNTCWWYDSANAEEFYAPPELGWPPEGPPWLRAGVKLADLMSSWRNIKAECGTGRHWMRRNNPPPKPLGSGPLATLKGHQQGVTSVAFLAYGQRLVSAARDGTIRIWDTSLGKEIASIAAHQDSINSIDVFADGKQLLSGSEDGTMRVWHLENLNEVANLSARSPSGIRSVAISPCNTQVAAAHEYGITVWDLATRSIRLEIKKTGIRSLKYLVGTDFIVSAGHEDLSFWSLTNGEQVQTGKLKLVNDIHALREGDVLGSATMIGTVKSIDISADGKQIATGADDGVVRTWDSTTGLELLRLYGHQRDVYCVKFFADGMRLISAGEDGTIRIWDPVFGSQLARISAHEDRVLGVAVSQDEGLIASGSADQSIGVWDVENPPRCPETFGHTDRVSGVAVSSNGSFVVSGGFDGTILTWGQPSGALRSRFRHELPPDFTPKANVGHTVPSLSPQLAEMTSRLTYALSMVSCIAISPDGMRILSGAANSTVRIWDTKTHAELGCLRGNGGPINAICVSPDGQHIGVVFSRKITIWNMSSYVLERSIAPSRSDLCSLNYSADGTLLAAGSLGPGPTSVFVVRAETGDLVASLAGHEGSITSVSFENQGRHLVSTAEDNTTRLWDLTTQTCLETIRGIAKGRATNQDSEVEGLHLLIQDDDTAILDCHGNPVTWIPDKPVTAVAFPDGRSWACAFGRNVYVLTLETPSGEA